MGDTTRPDHDGMVLPEAASCPRAACRLLGRAALVVLFAVGALSAPAQAYASSPNVPRQTQSWGDPNESAKLDAGDDADVDAAAGGLADRGEHGGSGAHAEHDDPVDSGGLDWVEGLGGPPDRDVPDLLQDELPRVTSTFVSGTVARMRTDGKAAIPRGAPKRVRTLLSQINSIIGKRYKWGGGHAKLVDKGYDCSGAVSYGLIKSGLLKYSMVSGRLARWGEAGEGRWVTIYANKRHVYMEVAGLRLDTNPFGDDPARKGVRWRPVIGQRYRFKVRHPAGL